MDVLLLRAGALGDVLLLRRAVAALRRAGHGIGLLAPAAGSVLAGEVSPVLRWDAAETTRVLAGEPANEPPGPLSAALASSDVVIALSRSAALLEALRARARRVLACDPAPTAAGTHSSLWLCGPLRELGLADFPDPPPLAFTDEERSAAQPHLAGLPGGFLALHPGSGATAKNWPMDRFLALAQRLSCGDPWLLVLGPAEDEARWRGASGAVIARELPLRVLGAVLSRAGLFVGNDSGVSHLAAAAGAPTLTLFGPTAAAVWSPVGRAVRCLQAPDGRLEALDLDAVATAAETLRPT